MPGKFWMTTALAAVLLATPGATMAETLRGALARTYANNEELNAARAQLRATDENVTQARAGLRPFVSGSISANGLTTSSTFGDDLPDTSTRSTQIGFGVQVNQTLFDGFQTTNNVRAAQAQVLASQQNLGNIEQNTLFDAAAIYMDVRRDRQIAALRRQNLAFLEEQVRAARARFEVGEGTRTDVAQAESQQALATALLNSALSQVATSEATYYQIVGDLPDDLQPADIPTAYIPSSFNEALAISQREHPAIQATIYAVDAASFQVEAAEGALLPQLGIVGTIDDTYTRSSSSPLSDLPGVGAGPRVRTENQITATIGAELTIPIYQGGRATSVVRQNKEVLGQRRIEVDGARDQVRAAVASAWAQLQAARANVTGYSAQVEAAQLALSGVIQERAVGQRTTLDVLNAQADVITAQILLVGARRDEVVAGYAVLSAIGRLSASELGLNVAVYDPDDHYIEVEDKWYGLRTPDGR